MSEELKPGYYIAEHAKFHPTIIHWNGSEWKSTTGRTVGDYRGAGYYIRPMTATPTIDEAAVERAMKAWFGAAYPSFCQEEEWVNDREDMRAALTAALTAALEQKP